MRLGSGAALVAAGAWVGYGWGAQCALPFVATWRGPAGRRQVSLTFDDGPDPEATPALLDILAARSARATFFLIGDRAARHPDVVRAIANGGHEIGTHTWHHRNAWFLGPRATEVEVVGGARLLGELSGRPPTLYRPPWGIVNAAGLRVARQAGLTTVLWSMQPEGLFARSAAEQLAYCRRRLHDGAIVCLHDAPGLPGAPARTLALVPMLLDLLADRGHAAVPVSALLS
jgi:peptidoglycan/xylan/chitin deacetylase (PgdA/CDA1 family)